MKIGLISDIHADARALRLALDILQGQGVDRILCAGDLVDKGVEGDAVVALIRARQIPSVLGNHDYIAERNQHYLLRNYGENHPMLLTEETLAYLDTLPDRLTYTLEDRRILVAHANPWSRDEYVFPYSKPALFKQVAQYAEADVVILGHTHEPMIALVDEVSIFNPGSVCGLNEHGSATCATLTLPDLIFRVFDLRTGNRVQPAYVEHLP